jgi:hypothetical protein
MSDLTRELRHFANAWCVLGNADLFTDAADEINRLREENARLREALNAIHAAIDEAREAK